MTFDSNAGGLVVGLFVTLSLFLITRWLKRVASRLPQSSSSPPSQSSVPGEALLVYIRLSDDEFGTTEERDRVHLLEDDLRELVAGVPGADVDGHEFGGGFGTIYIYAPSADQLFDTLAPTLLALDVPPGSYLIRRYGAPGARHDRIPLGETSTSAVHPS